MSGGTKGGSCGGGGGAGFESVCNSQLRVSADCKARDTVLHQLWRVWCSGISGRLISVVQRRRQRKQLEGCLHGAVCTHLQHVYHCFSGDGGVTVKCAAVAVSSLTRTLFTSVQRLVP